MSVHAIPNEFAFEKSSRDSWIFFVEDVLFHDSAAGYYSHDVPVDKPFGRCRIAELFANGNSVSVFDKSSYVVVDRVIRHAAHRRTLFESAISAGKRQIEHSRSSDGIVENIS